MFKRLGVFGLMLAAAGTALVAPATSFAQDRYDQRDGYVYYGRGDRRDFDGDRVYRRDREWREREARERAWREHEWRERERREYRDNRYGYAPGYYATPYYGRPY